MNKPPASTKHNRPKTRLVGILALLACFLVLLGVRLYVNHTTTGDEPHYLLMDYSLVHDHDLNLKNNYEHGDYRAFPLSSYGQIGKTSTHDPTKQYSIHAIGLPILLVPGFLLADKWGAVVEMVVIATILLWLTYLWSLQVTKSRKFSAIATAILLGCYFFNGLAGYIYPDMVVASLILSVLLILGSDKYAKPLYQAIFGLILGAIFLLHFRNLVSVGPLFLAMAYKLWRSKRAVPWATIAILSVVLAYFFFYMHRWFGYLNPSDIYPSDARLDASPLKTIPAILFDATRGLLVYNPAILLIFLGLPIWFKRKRATCIMTVLVLLPTMGLIAIFNEWQGGYAPAGRYLIDLLPAFMPAVAFALGQLSSVWQKVVAGILVTATLFVTAQATITRIPYGLPQEVWPKPALFQQIKDYSGVRLDGFLPHFSNSSTLNDRYGGIKILIGFVVVGSTIAYGYVLSKPLKPMKPMSKSRIA